MTLQLAAFSMFLVSATSAWDWRLRWSWTWPHWATFVSVVVCTLWVAAIYFHEDSPAGKGKRTTLAWLRLTALALVACMFAQPMLAWLQLGKPRVVVLIDRSASMAQRDVFHSTEDNHAMPPQTRLQRCREMLAGDDRSILKNLQASYDVEVVAFADRFQRLSSNHSPVAEQLLALTTADESSGTRLGDAVDFAIRGLPGSVPAAVVVLSDGRSTAGQSLSNVAEHAHLQQIPIFAVAVGSEHRSPDLAIENIASERVVFPGDRLSIEATLRAYGLEGHTVKISLREVDQENVIAQQSILLPNHNVTQTVRFAPQFSKPGPIQLELTAEPLAVEANQENNTARQIVKVRDEKIRVLLAQASPSYEYRALASLLRRDPAIVLQTRMQEADPGFSEVDPAAIESFPQSEKEFNQYDVVILGDVDPNRLPNTAWTMLEQFVSQQGGGLVCIAGPRFMPSAYRDNRSLRLLLPMEIESTNPLRTTQTSAASYPIALTRLGQNTANLLLGETRDQSKKIWRDLPPVLWLSNTETIKPGAQVLAEDTTHTNRSGQPLPAILRHYVGAGEVWFHATDETWRWRWRTDDRYFARYWGQLVRRLGRGRLTSGTSEVQLTSDRSVYEPGEEVRVQVRISDQQSQFANDAPVVELQATANPKRQLHLHRRSGYRGIFETVVPDLPADQYSAKLLSSDTSQQSLAAHFTVRSPPRELSRIAIDRRSLQSAAIITWGRFYTDESAANLVDDLPKTHEVVLDALPEEPLWNSHLVVGLLILVLASEWFLRRQWGML